MRIAHFYGHDGANGVSWSIVNASRFLEARGHQVHVICRTDSELMRYPAHSRTAYLYLAGLHLPPLRGLLRQVLRERQIDVLNVHSFRDAQVALQVAREIGVPTCYSCRELSACSCETAPLADRVIAVSVGVGKYVRDTYGIAPPVLHVIPNGINLALLPAEGRQTLRREQGFADDEFWLGFMGRIVPNKNVDGLVRAFHRAVRSAPNLRLVIIGAGRMEKKVHRLVADLGMDRRIRFTGWLPGERTFRVTGALDALVLPSHAAEGLNNALLAALALRVPVLSTDLPSLFGGPLRDGETGWLCGTDDESLTAGILRAAACGPEERLRLGAAGRAEIELNHRFETTVDKLEQAYQSALSSRAPILA